MLVSARSVRIYVFLCWLELTQVHRVRTLPRLLSQQEDIQLGTPDL